MGKRLVALGSSDPDFTIIGGTCSKNSPHLSQDLALLAGVSPIGIPCTASIEDLASADVLIDFSHYTFFPTVINCAKQYNIPVVIGTTGLGSSEHALMQEASKTIPIFHAPNFSVGMALLIKAIRHVSANIPQEFSISIEETHHTHKKDAPSGTALAIAATLHREVPITYKREGQVIGDHIVHFQSPLETIAFSHSALSRDLFAKGALLAAKFILRQPAGLFGMTHLISI
ncbi:MAG: 4-hydroxy-tetrahydrodipicolinate reductase [Simkania sp.]|nr:4-hydroxy-tetrahydrodipicolinate reductase [Simkania sp.]